MQLEKEIREIRDRLNYWGIKNQWLADKLGINKSTLSQYLSGTKQMPQEYIDKSLKVLPNPNVKA